MADMRWLRKLLLGISPKETSASVRGFPRTESPVRARLETVGATFVEGYMSVLDSARASDIERSLQSVPLDRRGFAYEGAAMSCALLDTLTPWNRSRFHDLLRGPGAPHVYLLYVGLGWARARLRKTRSVLARSDDPLFGWLTFDGMGFHEGFFHWRRSYEDRQRVRGIEGPAARVYDQGLGRCSWFVYGARIDEIADVIGRFAPERHEDLWGGVGLAAAYAGGLDRKELADLKRLAGEHWRALAQGATFAAEARERAGNPTEHTEAACVEFFGGSGREAAQLTEVVKNALPEGGDAPAYLRWRAGIREQLH